MNSTWNNALPLKPLTQLIPVVTLVLFTLIVTLPWGLPPEMSYVPPLLVLGLIFSWTLRCPNLISPLVVFLIGIAVDVVTASPIGFWSLLLLVGYALARRASTVTFLWPTVQIFLLYIPTATMVGFLAWLIASTYFGQLIEWRPVVGSLKIAIIAAPLIAIVTRVIEKMMVVTPRRTSEAEII